MAIEIEKGIEIPQAWRSKKGARKYPFGDLAVGDSFVVELEHRKSWNFIFAAITKAQKELGIKVTTRLLDDGKRRVWRTE